MVWAPRTRQTLQTLWFGNPERPKRYKCNGLALRARQTLQKQWFGQPERPKRYKYNGLGGSAERGTSHFPQKGRGTRQQQ